MENVNFLKHFIQNFEVNKEYSNFKDVYRYPVTNVKQVLKFIAKDER